MQRKMRLARNPWAGQGLPTPEALKELQEKVAESIVTANARARQRLVSRFRNKRKEKITKETGALYRDFRDPDAAPLAVIKRPDGTITGSVREMDQLIRKDWLPIFAKHSAEHGDAAERTPPCPMKFMEKYGHLLTMTPQEVEAIALEDLHKAITKLGREGAGGLDGWTPKDIKYLPDWVLELLLSVYDLVEEKGVWPKAMAWAGISLIPKGEGGAPLDLRPITVSSVIYRIWAAVRMRHSIEWQETWITRGQHGARAKHSTVDIE